MEQFCLELLNFWGSSVMLLSFTLDELSCILIPNLLQRESLSATEDTWRTKKIRFEEAVAEQKAIETQTENSSQYSLIFRK